MKKDGGNLRKGEMLKNVRASVSRLLEAKHCVYPRLLSGGGTGSRVATVGTTWKAGLLSSEIDSPLSLSLSLFLFSRRPPRRDESFMRATMLVDSIYSRDKNISRR